VKLYALRKKPIKRIEKKIIRVLFLTSVLLI